jgi:hypothetical protein
VQRPAPARSRHGAARFGAIEHRLEVGNVHLRDHLPSAHHVAFGHRDPLDAARKLGGDVDLVGLDPAVTPDDAVGKVVLPRIHPGDGGIGRADTQEQEQNQADSASVHL